jgi:hypothetical protein
LLLVFLAVTALLALVQTRFGGEAAIVAAMLGGLVPRHLLTVPASVSREPPIAGQALALASQRRARRQERRRKRLEKENVMARAGMTGRVLVLSGLALLFVVPAALVAPDAIRNLPAEDPDWEAAMSWMRSNSPDLFSPPLRTAAPVQRPSWWDNGYTIARLVAGSR